MATNPSALPIVWQGADPDAKGPFGAAFTTPEVTTLQNLAAPSWTGAEAQVAQALAAAAKSFLPRYQFQLTRTAAGVADTIIAYMADSTGAGAFATGVDWPNNRPFAQAVLLADWLAKNLGLPVSQDSAYGQGSSGAALTYDSRVTRTTWGGLNDGNPGSLGGGTYRSDNAQVSAINLQGAVSCDTVDVTYLTNSGGATFDVFADGVNIGNASQTGGLNIVTTSFPCARGVRNVSVQRRAGAGFFCIYGIGMRDTGSRRVRVLNWAAGGSSLLEWRTTASPLDRGAIATNTAAIPSPHLIFVQLGLNDAIAASAAGAWVTSTVYAVGAYVTQGGVTYGCAVAHTAGVFATDLAAGNWLTVNAFAQRNYQALVDLYRPNSDIVFVVPAPISAVSATLAIQRDIVTACRQVAQANGCWLIDQAAQDGTYLFAVAQGDYLPANDPVHKGAAGYTKTNALVRLLPGLLG